MGSRNTMESRERRYACVWMALIVLSVLGLFGLVSVRLFWLHVIEAPDESADVMKRYTSRYTLLGLRGRILDRNGEVLAESMSGRIIRFDQRDPKLERLTPEERAALPYEISKLLGVSEEKVLDAMHGVHTWRGRRTYTTKLCEISNDGVLAEIAKRTSPGAKKGTRLAGLSYNELLAVRSHPNGARLGHVLGYINNEGVGVYGIEQEFNSVLTGKNGEIRTMVDARRREIRDRRLAEKPAEHGHDVVLTIDNTVQYIIESALSKALEQFRASSGMIVVQQIHTGEILGMATLPGFNPQDYNTYPPDSWKNIAVSRNYEPGSVMKAVTVAMAMQYGVITENSVFDVGNSGVWYYAGKPLRDHAYGKIRPWEVLARSSNIASAMIGLRMAEPRPSLGIENKNELLWRGFRAMGFGRKTGIELVGEETGILRPYEKWDKLTPTRVPIGQSISVTAVQLCNAFSTIANGGKLMQPTILREIRTHDGQVESINYPKMLGRPLSPRIGAKVLDMLSHVTDRSVGGTARRATLRSYTVAGKTGTGQIPVNGAYNHSDYNASFVGIYPATAPQLAILVTIEKPKGLYRMGGSVAAPVFAMVAEDIGHYLGIPADKFPKDAEL